MKRMFAAGIDQARGVPWQWEDGWEGYGERFASREGQFITANSLACLGKCELKYEPRYDRCQCKGFWPRTRHAIVRNFITFNETEVELPPQLALYGGAFGGGWFQLRGSRIRAMPLPKAGAPCSVRRATARC